MTADEIKEKIQKLVTEVNQPDVQIMVICWVGDNESKIRRFLKSNIPDVMQRIGISLDALTENYTELAIESNQCEHHKERQIH